MATQESQRTHIDTGLDGIAHVLRDRPLEVPPYQRPYSWQREQVEAFWSDLRSALSLANPEYFMGTIVVTASGPSVTVIDGQQRLATTAILLAAVRDVFRERGDIDRATVLEREYLVSRSLRSAESQPRLRLTADDGDYFAQLMTPNSLEPVPDQSIPSHQRMQDAAEVLRKAVDREAEDAGGNWAERLFEWVEFLEEGVRVIVVSVPNDADAFLIFETLNDRGLDLNIADLLKNYLFSLTRDDITATEVRWANALAAFEMGAEEHTFTTFIRHYWCTTQGATRERELYRSLKRRIRSPLHAAELVSELEEAAPSYAALLSSKHPRWEELGVPTTLSESLLRLGLEQNRPLVLAGMRFFTTQQLLRLMGAMLSWAVRGLIVGGIGGGTYERYYSDAATTITNGQAKTADDVFAALDPIVPRDEDFREAFSNRRVNNSTLATYYLYAIESAMQSGAPGANVVSAAELAEVSLDLVVPRRAEHDAWPGFQHGALGQWALRLGNQYLLPSGVRRPNRRSDWEEKRRIIAEVDRPIAQIITQHSDWAEQSVREVQRWMADVAPAIWPREAA